MVDMSETSLRPAERPPAPPHSLRPDEWRARRDRHERRVDGWLADHLARRQHGVKHPVHDFMFSYYSLRPAQLRRWRPGIGTVLLDAGPERDEVAVAGGATVDPALAGKRRDTAAWIRDLLTATASRAPHFGCFGMHEWAMVYRQDQQEVRHNAWPLRLTPDRTAQVVQERGVRCSHFDAFRFFTPPARPLNLLTPTRESQQELEQPGCLHANMDLYKWSYKLAPLTPSELIADCFELARDVRALDMRASPYDLASLGFPPVRVETPEGRAEYTLAQREFSRRSAPLRERLIAACEAILAA
jgi:hypothetical protein